jgi:hypothetical protein
MPVKEKGLFGDSMIIQGDCMDAMRDLIAQGVQVDSIVTDPPYELGFMGKVWDKTGIAYNRLFWKLCFDLLKPGGHLLSFGGSRTYHRMACAVEDAGFEVRDQIMWVFGQGFPKGLDVSKAIDKMAGAERKVVGSKVGMPGYSISPGKQESIYKGGFGSDGDSISECQITAPATEAAKKWQGWGTALKPAHEPIVLARKPLSEKTIAENVLKYGTGGINVDGCRVEITQQDKEQLEKSNYTKRTQFSSQLAKNAYQFVDGSLKAQDYQVPSGRFPANLIHDGSDEVEEEFAKYGERKTGSLKPYTRSNREGWAGDMSEVSTIERKGDSGSASRFFYCAKASKKDRMGSNTLPSNPLV